MSEVQTDGKVCSCGRGYSHCRACGSRNVYAKRFRSLELSETVGRRVTVFGCRRCSEESNETEECKAPSREFQSGFKPYQKEAETLPWGLSKPGSEQYFVALTEAAVKLTESKRMTLIQAYVELKRQGWALE